MTRWLNRRSFLQGLVAASAGISGRTSVAKASVAKASVAKASLAKVSPRVVVIGGGVAGVAASRYLGRHFPEIEMTVVEPNPGYTSCFSSGAVLGGLRDRATLDFTYGAVQREGNIKWVRARADHIDTDKSLVHLSDAATIPYDRLIVSPGISLRTGTIEGLDAAAQARFPHGYVLGHEIDDLRKRLSELDDGALVVLSAPERPYRCTPAPYERASMIAHYLKTHKPGSKVLVLDSKNEFPLMDRILPAWERFYGDMIEWVPAEFGGAVTQVNKTDGTIVADGETLSPDFANIIPAQQAGDIAVRSGLTGEDGWCPVHAATLESTRVANVHVIGDAADAGDMSKSAHAAASLGRSCAASIGQALTGRPAPDVALDNACYFLIARDHGLKVGGTYLAKHGRISGVTGFASKIGETDEERRRTAEDGNRWFDQFTRSLFE